MKKNQIYKCSLTVRLIKKNYNGKKVLGTQLVHVPIMGRQGSKYHISYRVGLPKHFHLARHSLSRIAGRIHVLNGHAFLSNNNESFVYEADAGYLVVQYVNQSNQRVGYGMTEDDLGDQLANVTDRVPVPRGYQCGTVLGQIKSRVQFLNVRVQGRHVSQEQSNFKITERKVDHNGKLLGQQIHIIHVAGRIGDSFSLHPADYRFSGTQPLPKTADVNGTLTPAGPKPRQASFTYVQTGPQQKSYPLTIKVLKKDRDRIQSHTVIKQVRGPLNYSYLYSFRAFQPDGYRLNPNSITSVSGRITKHGLTQPTAAFLYDRVAVTKVKYINQNNQQVGSSQIKGLKSHKFNQIMRQLKLPSGYSFSPRQQDLHPGSATIVRVQGAPANHQQSEVRLLIVERYRNGKVSKRPRVIHVSGRIGDHFMIKPRSQQPQGFHDDHNRPVSGVITFSGTRLDHRTLVYVQNAKTDRDQSAQSVKSNSKPGRILVYYLNRRNQMIGREVLHGPIGTPIKQAGLLDKVPQGYRYVKLVSGHQVSHFQTQDQIITIGVARLRKTSNQAASSAGSSTKKAATVQASQTSSQAAGSQKASEGSAAQESAKQKSAGRQRSARPTRFSLIKQTFLDHCYSQIFGTNLVKKPKNHHQQLAIKMGIKLADDYIQGVKDALHHHPKAKSASHSYQYGYQGCIRFVKNRTTQPSLVTVLLTTMKRLSLNNIRN